MIAILGAGKMGEALLSGMLRAGVAPSAVIAAVRGQDRAESLRDSYGIEVTSAGDTADKVVISVAAGIPTGFIESRLAADLAVVRVMSNTPVLVDEAMSVISPGRHAGERHLRKTEELLRPVGKVLRIPESQQDAATALSGSGPAYVYFLVESMVDPVILLEAVTSPGGTTISAIRELERHGVRAAFIAAIEAARDRGRELGGG